MLPLCKCCQFTLAISNKGGVANWQLTALLMATMAYWQHLTPHHAPPKRRRKAGNKRCVAKDVLLRTFCPFPAQGLGGWCAEIVSKRGNNAKKQYGKTGHCSLRTEYDILHGVKKRLCIHLKLDSNIMDIKRDFYLELLG